MPLVISIINYLFIDLSMNKCMIRYMYNYFEARPTRQVPPSPLAENWLGIMTRWRARHVLYLGVGLILEELFSFLWQMVWIERHM